MLIREQYRPKDTRCHLTISETGKHEAHFRGAESLREGWEVLALSGATGIMPEFNSTLVGGGR